jgi:uncharacterized protein YndB with AHSA1/START domain
MAPLVSTIEIARSPRDIFAFATDPERFPEWQRDVTSARMLGAARFATTRRIAGSERTQVQVITHSDPPVGWGARGVEGPIRASATITIESVGDGTISRVTFTLDFEGQGIGKALLPLVRRQAEKVAPVSYRNLKRLLEA